MRTSNPASYDKIFSIYAGSGVLSTGTNLDFHRGLLLINTTTSAITNAVVVKNVATGELVTLAIAPGSTILPLQVQAIGIASQNASIFIYGLK